MAKQKTATRKVATKKTTKTATPKKAVAKAKKTISYKSIGRNVILLIDGQKFTKAFKLKEDRTNVQTLVEAYNKRNSLRKEKQIIDIMLADKTTATERKQALKKATPKEVVKPKEAVSTLTEEEAKAFLEKQGYKVSKQEAKTAPVKQRRSGEY